MFTATGGGNPPVNVVAPALDNLSPNVGDTITCSQGTWTGATSYAYQWVKYPNTFILGQTTNQYVVQVGDAGFKFFCQVQAINAVGNTIVDSDITNLVAGGDPLAGITFALRLQASKGFGSTPNAPFSLYQDVFGASPATADGDPVALWRDELGTSGLSAVQSNPLFQPTLRIVNGKPTLDSNGGTAKMTVAFGSDLSQPVTLIWLGAKSTNTGGFQDPIDGVESGKRMVIAFDSSGQFNMYAGGGSTTIGGAVDNNYHSLIPIYDGSNSKGYIDGVEQPGLAADSGPDVLSGLTIGDAPMGGQAFNGADAAIFVYVGHMSDADRAKMDSYNVILSP